jgi:hypothetical protein
MKKPPTILIAALILWAAITSAYYLGNHFELLKPLNDIESLNQFILYVIFAGAGLVTVIGALFILKDEVKSIKKWKLNSFVGLGIFFLLAFVLSLSRFLWGGYTVYQGPTLITDNNEIVVYQGQSIEYSDLILKSGDLVSGAQIQYGDFFSGELDTYFASVGIGEAAASTLWGLLVPLILTLAFLIVFYAAGATLLKQGFKVTKMEGKFVLFSIGLGIILTSFYGFILAQLAIYYLAPVLAFAVLCLIVGRSSLLELFNWLKKASIPLKKLSVWHWIFVPLAFIFVAMNFVQASAPAPAGYDDFSLYMNLPNVLAHTHTFIQGQLVHAFALVQGMAVLIQKNTQAAQLITSMLGLLSVYGVFLFIKEYLKTSYALLGSGLILSLPLFMSFSAIEYKVEFVLFFLGTLALLSLQNWLKKLKINWLLLAGLFAGFSFSVKATAFFFLPAILFLVAYKLWGKWGSAIAFLACILLFCVAPLTNSYAFSFLNTSLFLGSVAVLLGLSVIMFLLKELKDKKLFSKLITFILLGVMLLIPNLPWFTYNILSYDSFSLSGLFIHSEIPFGESLAELGMVPTQASAGVIADYERYSISRGSELSQYLLLPWDISINVSPLSPLVNIGLIFLAFCPALLLFLFKKSPTLKQESSFWTFSLSGVVFWFFWSLFAKNVIWYGIIGFPFLVLWLIGGLYALLSNKKWVNLSVCALLIVWIVFSAFFRFNLYFSRTSVLSAHTANLLTYEEYMSNRFPEYLSLAEIINIDAESSLYLTDNAFFYYFIDNNVERVYQDRFLDLFNNLYQEKDDELLLARLSTLGFDYVLLSQPIYDPDFPESLTKASQEWLTFASNYLTFVGGNQDTYLFALE